MPDGVMVIKSTAYELIDIYCSLKIVFPPAAVQANNSLLSLLTLSHIQTGRLCDEMMKMKPKGSRRLTYLLFFHSAPFFTYLNFSFISFNG